MVGVTEEGEEAESSGCIKTTVLYQSYMLICKTLFNEFYIKLMYFSVDKA
ncbi:hypothetical protein KDI_05500 [Dictyobacter arantiisoli]|uniref:Uncharacterized protein n=1 Tax=Dictyobacter arantiisoli TaxID=2014874 RepID=A0A5A5T721_9CHLR|nr:hypothetical protein KDI_05500 [Dictyobacter arantiisoli]